MGKKSDPPPPPDYAALSEQQAAASKANTEYQTRANRPDLNTPWGTQTWNEGQDGNWSSSIQLSPQQQMALDSQMAVQTGRSQGAEQLLGGAVGSLGSGIDYSGAPDAAGRVQAGTAQGMQNTAGDWREKAQNAVWDLQQPGLDRSREALNTRLANQGITMGSEAHASAMREQGDSEARARLMGIDAGRQEANMLFGQDAQSTQIGNQAINQNVNMGTASGAFNQQLRQQSIAEMLNQRSQPLNELNALLTGQQVSNPQMPSFSQAQRSETPQMLNAANMGYQASMDGYNADQQSMAGLTSGLFGLGSAAMGNPMGLAGLFGMK